MLHKLWYRIQFRFFIWCMLHIARKSPETRDKLSESIRQAIQNSTKPDADLDKLRDFLKRLEAIRYA